MRILWISNVPSPYRVAFFSKLGQLCDLTVIFEMQSSKERDLSWKEYSFDGFLGIILNGIEVDVDKTISLSIVKYIKRKEYDHIVISNIASPTGIIASEYMQFMRIPYIIEGDGGTAKNGIGIKEKIKKRIIGAAKGYFSTGKAHDFYYVSYGAEIKNIYRYPFTSIYQKDILKDVVENCEKKRLKNELGIKEDFTVLSIGQFIHRKGFDILIKSCEKIDRNIGVHIIGGKPNTEYLEIVSKLRLNNVYFHEFMLKNEIFRWLKAADIFAFPTREDIWGLVINEAMAVGLPIITTDKCMAGLELIENGSNGYIIPVENITLLAEYINILYKDEILRMILGRNNIKKINEYTLEKMAIRHIEVFNMLSLKNQINHLT